MRDSTTLGRETLLIDLESGTVLNAPPEVTVSTRYIDSHPFAHATSTHVVVGPDSEKVSQGAGGEDYILYEILRTEIGNYYLKRDAS